MRVTVVVLAIVSLVASAALAKKEPPVACEGLFRITGGDLSEEPDVPSINTLTIAGDQITLDGCGTVTGKVKAKRKATLVQAVFENCGAVTKLRFRARLTGACTGGSGLLKGKRGSTRLAAKTQLFAAESGPIDAPLETWTWVPITGMQCANGAPTGIGINRSTKSERVVLFLNGGGACWDEATCYDIATAVNIVNGYTEETFQTEASGLLTLSLFDRTEPTNPFKDASFVYVPYCTGDVHGGDAIQDYGGKRTYHVGFRNFAAILPRLLATFPNPERVIISGSSAGGFGAAFNWPVLKEAYGDTRVDLIDDCGPPLPTPYADPAITGVWRTAWNLTFPADCVDCAEHFDAYLDYLAPKYPNDRAAFLAFTEDPVLRIFFQLDATEMTAATLALADGALSRHPNVRYFVKDQANHVMLFTPAAIEQNGVNLLEWLTQMYADDPAWVSVQP